MKLSNIKLIIASLTLITGLNSCDDWLDVSPKSQIQEQDHFSYEGGYRDQLTGVYTSMSSQSMYGLNMGIGFTEVLSQNYDVNSDGMWRYPSEYDYNNWAGESTINTIWNKTYKTIANLNLIIKNINEANPAIFTENHFSVSRHK